MNMAMYYDVALGFFQWLTIPHSTVYQTKVFYNLKQFQNSSLKKQNTGKQIFL